MFGQLPTLLENILATLSPECSIEYVRRHLTALHKARVAFVASESSEKIQRALRMITRQFDDHFPIGSEVFYLRDKNWSCPGTFLGPDGPNQTRRSSY